MKEFQGTKGKWEVKHSESKEAFNVVGSSLGEHYKIARIPYLVTDTLIEVNNREKKEAELNAILIAAAPELLKELKLQFDKMDKGSDSYLRVGKLLDRIL
ncbi:hypothetical protein [Flavobacterium sp. GT3P67]|uniref:hypothetical protein n=1 Tax=Flavobacterium sp. GT3P67 TaxID=2541722 RepID=UPI0014050B6E|nr:hypothetical protein [Flavobacterium sp. GT3P67]